jgi:hypothetical protein
MTNFASMFIKSDGKAIQYKGRTLVMWDQLPLPSKEVNVKYRIVSTNSEWKQGIAVATKGVLEFWDKERVKKGWADLWEHLVDWESEFTCRSRDGLLNVKNVWRTPSCECESWTNGAAMWIEEIPNGRRYHCNDGHFDDDFDDIIFELTILD